MLQSVQCCDPLLNAFFVPIQNDLFKLAFLSFWHLSHGSRDKYSKKPQKQQPTIRGMLSRHTVDRWLPTCTFWTTWWCRCWPGTCGWGSDEELVAVRPECHVAGTWVSPTRPSDLCQCASPLLVEQHCVTAVKEVLNLSARLLSSYDYLNIITEV